MKCLGVSKKKLIGFVLILCILVMGFSVYRVNAATAITQNESTVTVEVPKEIRQDYDGAISAKLVRLADISSYAEFENPIEDSFLDGFSTYTAENQAAFLKEKIDDANEIIASMSKEELGEISYDVDIKAGENSVVVTVKNGLYLLAFNGSSAEGKSELYTFMDSLFVAPLNYYTSDNGAKDEWLYNFNLELKYGHEPLFASLQINKTLNSYNVSLGNTTFIYSVEAKKGDSVVYSNVVSMDFDKAGKSSLVVTGIPANTDVVVTEVYSGAAYAVSGDKLKTINGLPSDNAVANGTPMASVDFVNDYDTKLITGSIATVNTVTYVDEQFGISEIGTSSKNSQVEEVVNP